MGGSPIPEVWGAQLLPSSLSGLYLGAAKVRHSPPEGLAATGCLGGALIALAAQQNDKSIFECRQSQEAASRSSMLRAVSWRRMQTPQRSLNWELGHRRPILLSSPRSTSSDHVQPSGECLPWPVTALPFPTLLPRPLTRCLAPYLPSQVFFDVSLRRKRPITLGMGGSGDQWPEPLYPAPPDLFHDIMAR